MGSDFRGAGIVIEFSDFLLSAASGFALNRSRQETAQK
jgi:hypothetical protein